ncbi:hypothetical protein GFER_04480 [Geoalkalibacter ferrihydriticus DSM 17813]|uniref:Uncharacterized protein n=1 Tax=Geoalkalibacter ferrihydriticus DSM 17813 TaxID=1121915 RepID=A0A0C2HYP4_9BACT|nr:hypothetical protein GFER_04480 [Geoalkalibacter ferrihydriticus DSM 17813]
MAVLGFALMAAQAVTEIADAAVTGNAVADQCVGGFVVNILQPEAVTTGTVAFGIEAFMAAKAFAGKEPGCFMMALGHVLTVAIGAIYG